MRESFDSQTYYHIYNRGVDKRILFEDERDYRRFYESMYLLTDKNFKHPGGNTTYPDMLLAGAEVLSMDRQPLVSVVAFCLMTNHFHMLVKAIEPDGISRYYQRLGNGYAHYFNLRHARSGRLFESPFKAVPVDTEEHLQLLPRYIHLNALDKTSHAWRDGQSPDWEQAGPFLSEYQWSSHSLYAGNEQLLPLVDENAVRKWFPTSQEYDSYLKVSTIFGEELTFVRHLAT